MGVDLSQNGYSPSFGPGPKQRTSISVSGGPGASLLAAVQDGGAGGNANGGFRRSAGDSLGSSVNSVASNGNVLAGSGGGSNGAVGKKADLMRELFGGT